MLLSKSQYIRGLQCHKSHWLYENKFEWNGNRVQKIQYVIEKRVLDLYHKIIDDLEFEQWNKHDTI